MTDAAPVVLEGVAVRYPNGTWALDGLDWQLPAGRVTALVGPNGSGKSTLLKLIGAGLQPTRGRLRLFGREPAGTWPRALRRRVAYVAQDPALDPEMQVAELCAYFAALHGLDRPTGRRRTDDLLAALGLAELGGARVARLSGGQRGRLHVVLGLLQPADLYLLDEPDAALDRAGRTALWGLLRTAADRGAAVAVASHHGDTAQAHADDVLALAAGRRAEAPA